MESAGVSLPYCGCSVPTTWRSGSIELSSLLAAIPRGVPKTERMALPKFRILSCWSSPNSEKVTSRTKNVSSRFMQSLNVTIHSGAPATSSGGASFFGLPIGAYAFFSARLPWETNTWSFSRTIVGLSPLAMAQIPSTIISLAVVSALE